MALKVPLLDLQKQNAELEPRLTEAFARVLKSGRFIGGPEVEGFEKAVATLVGAPHAIGVSSGTDAILLALMALEIGPGDEVICPSFTFFATAGCVARLGATPVFTDCCPVCFNMDVADARRRITAKTKAIMPVHLFGQCADMDAVLSLAADYNLAVIEDAAQALGACYKGRAAGSMGLCGTFSFYPSKNLGGFGDAGMLVTQDAEFAAKARLLRNHGAEARYFHKKVGGNFRLDPLQAALLAVKLERLDSYSQRRGENARYYTSHLAGIDGLVLPEAHPYSRHIWNQYTVQVPSRRDAFREFLASRDIGSEIYYPLPLHAQECFATLAAPSLPVAERLSAGCVSLPIYPELTREQLDAVVDAIREFHPTRQGLIN